MTQMENSSQPVIIGHASHDVQLLAAPRCLVLIPRTLVSRSQRPVRKQQLNDALKATVSTLDLLDVSLLLQAVNQTSPTRTNGSDTYPHNMYA